MEQFEVEYVVVGAGVVGLSVARALAQLGKDVLLVDQAETIGTGISSRNSEVIHAGIYYPEGSLKARLCLQGKQMLYRYCTENQIPHKRLGKLIVAQNDADLSRLAGIQQHAQRNGVDDICFFDQNQLKAHEPELNAKAALYSPSTGIIDSHAFMQQLQADFEYAGGQCVFNTQLRIVSNKNQGICLESLQDGTRILAKQCINATGLGAVSFCQDVMARAQAYLPKAYFAKGCYFSYQGRVPFQRLIYPIPENGGLGVHLTLDMNRVAKFGPDVDWLPENKELNYDVEIAKRDAFAQAIRRYWPALEETKLCPDYAGIRPKISGPAEPAADFSIRGEREHGVKGLINLLGIESPGLTSALAIAEYVLSMPDFNE